VRADKQFSLKIECVFSCRMGYRTETGEITRTCCTIRYRQFIGDADAE
jgi:hypothetical protein